jgi:hypothetical protein
MDEVLQCRRTATLKTGARGHKPRALFNQRPLNIKHYVILLFYLFFYILQSNNVGFA